MNKLMPLEFKNQRIMTTKVLADEYGTEETNIKTNFNNNKGRFIEGKHYYQLTGEKLKQFKRVVNDINDPSIKFASVLTLWTDRGAAEMMEIEHSKLLRKIDGINEDFTKSKIAFSKYWIEGTYIKYLTNGKIRSLDFFIESTYQDSKRETRPCYLLTKQGCEMVDSITLVF